MSVELQQVMKAEHCIILAIYASLQNLLCMGLHCRMLVAMVTGSIALRKNYHVD